MLTIVVVLLHIVNHDENAFRENMIWLAEGGKPQHNKDKVDYDHDEASGHIVHVGAW
jgi:hypothetical protein